jgi:CheY-like chemotaxis protein
LSRHGHKVFEAGDGFEALEVLKERHREVELVLLDLTMPKKNGYDTLLEIKSSWPHIPVVLCSGYSSDEVLQQAQGEVQGFLKKPFTEEQLMLEVDRLGRTTNAAV